MTREAQAARDDKTFRQNYDTINWKKEEPERCPKCDLERDQTYHSCWNCGHPFDP